RPGGDLRGVPSGRDGLRAQARGHGARAGPDAEVHRAARRQDRGRRRARQGIHLHRHTSGEAMAGELILIVEDNENNRILVRDVLQWRGYQTEETDTAEEGLRLAQTALPALILMDIQLPGMNGIEALKRLRADAATREIPVMAVTASAMTQDRQTIMAAGF